MIKLIHTCIQCGFVEEEELPHHILFGYVLFDEAGQFLCIEATLEQAKETLRKYAASLTSSEAQHATP